MPVRMTHQVALWATRRKLGPRLCLLSFSTWMLGCDAQMQAPSASPLAPATQRESALATPQAGLVEPAPPAALPAQPARAGVPETAAIDTRPTALPLVAPIPLRGQLNEDLVYEGVLDPYETQGLVRALEEANRDNAASDGAR